VVVVWLLSTWSKAFITGVVLAQSALPRGTEESLTAIAGAAANKLLLILGSCSGRAARILAITLLLFLHSIALFACELVIFYLLVVHHAAMDFGFPLCLA